jgi:hypothetical protein
MYRDALDLCREIKRNTGGLPRTSYSAGEFVRATADISSRLDALPVDTLQHAMKRTGLPACYRRLLWSWRGADTITADTERTGGDVCFVAAGKEIIRLSEFEVYLRFLHISEGTIHFDFGFPPLLFADEDFLSWSAQVNGVIQPLAPSGEYTGKRLYGNDVLMGTHARLSIPVQTVPATVLTIRLFAGYQTKQGTVITTPVRIRYMPASHLSQLPAQYYAAAGLVFRGNPHRIVVQECTAQRQRWHELRFQTVLFSLAAWGGVRAAAQRRAVLRSRRNQLARPIWLFMDKVYASGDCGESLFRQVCDAHPEIDARYVLNANVQPSSTLLPYRDRIIHPGSTDHLIAYANAEVVWTTYASPLPYNGFTGLRSHVMRDLLDGRIFHIQHGLSMQALERMMHRSKAGIDRYYCASKYEIENLSQPEYGYRPDQLVHAGIPRFDELSNRRERRIMIAPTWRPEITAAPDAVNHARKRNTDFEQSDFYQIYRALLENRRLLDCARETGYHIDFALHPYLLANADAFLPEQSVADSNDIVHLVLPDNTHPYAGFLERAALLVTDYSGVQYDFAWMRKPLVYFQPPELPPQYGVGAMDYHKRGFGPVTTSIDALVDALCDAMHTNCMLADNYRACIEDFFEGNPVPIRAAIIEDALNYLDSARATDL